MIGSEGDAPETPRRTRPDLHRRTPLLDSATRWPPLEDELELRVLSALDAGVVVLDTDGRYRWANQAAEALLGVPLERFRGRTITTAPWRCITLDGQPLPPEATPGIRASRGEARVNARLGIVHEGHEGGEASTTWIEADARVFGAPEESAGVVVTIQDIGEEVRAEQAGRQLADFNAGLLELTQRALATGLDENFYQLVTDSAVALVPGAQSSSLIMRDADGRYRFRAATNYDLALLSTIHLTEEELATDITDPRVQIVRGFDNRHVSKDRRAVIESGGRSNDIRVSLAVPVVIEGTSIAFFHVDNFDRNDAFDADAVAMAQLLGAQVATLWRRFSLEQQLEHLAHFDPLTGLPNRRRLEQRIERELARLRARAERGVEGGAVGALLIDLDDFKEVNDRFGHAFGDELVRAVAGRLRAVAGPDDLLARWGGDEFVLLVVARHGEERIGAAAVELLATLEAPIEVRGVAVRTRASLGLALARDGRSSAEEMIRHADIALYRAKAEERGSVRVFDARMQQAVEVRQQLEHEFQAGLDRGEFVLFYQPRVDLRSGRVTGVEALVRWHHPERGLLAPDAFIPFAETSGLILPLGRHILELAAARAAAWRAAGREITVAVNLSARQLASADLVDFVRRVLKHHALPGNALEFEVTETTAVADVQQSAAYLGELRELGAGVALDDFGIAYSALGLLAQLPITALKIDRSFVKRLSGPEVDGKALRIVQAVIALGQSLDLNVVAEGIETEEQQRVLVRAGCRAAQGYRYARPVADPDLDAVYEV